MDSDFSARLTLACDIAREAGRLTLQYFQRDNLEIEQKRDATPVTIADREAERLLRQRIAAEFAADSVLGEEFGEQLGDSGFRWILDPIDGTKSFIHGVPLYAVLIGVEHQGHCRIGVIHMPALEETVYAASGHGAWHICGKAQPRPAKASTTNLLSEGLLVTSTISGFQKRDAWPLFERLTKTARLARTWGDAYGYLLVATGRAEVMIDPALNIWDAAPLLPILEEAGGTFTDWKGQPTIHGGEGIATNGVLLEETLRLINA